MLSANFFVCFWLTFIGLVAMLGLSTAMLAGASLRSGEIAAGITATVLTLACGLVCGIAQDTCRSLKHKR